MCYINSLATRALHNTQPLRQSWVPFVFLSLQIMFLLYSGFRSKLNICIIILSESQSMARAGSCRQNEVEFYWQMCVNDKTASSYITACCHYTVLFLLEFTTDGSNATNVLMRLHLVLIRRFFFFLHVHTLKWKQNKNINYKLSLF